MIMIDFIGEIMWGVFTVTFMVHAWFALQEFFSNKADASLFVFGSTSKKRPNNLVVGM